MSTRQMWLWIIVSVAGAILVFTAFVSNVWRFTDTPRYSEIEARAKVQEYVARTSNGDMQNYLLRDLAAAPEHYDKDHESWIFVVPYNGGQARFWQFDERTNLVNYIVF